MMIIGIIGVIGLVSYMNSSSSYTYKMKDHASKCVGISNDNHENKMNCYTTLTTMETNIDPKIVSKLNQCKNASDKTQCMYELDLITLDLYK